MKEEYYTLDLSKNNLSEIPITYRRVHWLILSNNNLINIKNIQYYKDVTRLALNDNYLIRLESGINALANLNWLDLTRNRLSELPFINLKNLNGLGLSENNFDRIPSCVFNLINLRKFGFFSNRLKVISPLIGNLINLTKLDLSNNHIKALPKELFGLKKLTWLNLSNNQIKSVDGINNLVQLEELGLGNNQIEEVDITLNNLKILPLFNNKIQKIRIRMCRIEKLDFSDNQIEHFDWRVLECKKLRYLNLKNNKIKEIRLEENEHAGYCYGYVRCNGINYGNGACKRNGYYYSGRKDGDRCGRTGECVLGMGYNKICDRAQNGGWADDRAKDRGRGDTYSREHKGGIHRNEYSSELYKQNSRTYQNSKSYKNSVNSNKSTNSDGSTSDNHSGTTYYSRYNGYRHNFNSVHEKYGSAGTTMHSHTGTATHSHSSTTTDHKNNYIPLFTNTAKYTHYSTFYDLSVSPNLSVLDLSNNHIPYMPFSCYFKLKHVNTLRMNGNKFVRSENVSGGIGTLGELCFNGIVNRDRKNMVGVDGSRGVISRELIGGNSIGDFESDGAVGISSNWSNNRTTAYSSGTNAGSAYSNRTNLNASTDASISTTYLPNNSSIHFNKISFNCSEDTNPINPTKLKNKRQCDTCLRYFITDPFIKCMEYNDIVLMFVLCSVKCGNGFVDKG